MPVAQVNLREFPLQGNSLIEASAGTGKTFTISHLYLRFLLETDFGVEQILVVTFTNAATQELKGRIRDLIYEVREYLKGSSLQEKELQNLFKDYRGQQTALDKLQKALINFDDASIYSIHGFCQRVLTRFPVETGSMLQQQIIPDEKDLYRASIRDYWRQKIIAQDLDRLQWILSLWNQPDDLLREALPLMHLDDEGAELIQLQEVSLDDELTRIWQDLVADWQTKKSLIKDVLLDNPALSKSSYKAVTIESLWQELGLLFAGSLPYQLPQKWLLLGTEKLRASLLKKRLDERIEQPFFQRAQVFLELHGQWLRQQRIEILLDVATVVQDRVAEAKRKSLNISFNELITRLSDVLHLPEVELADKITYEYPVAMVDEFQDTDNRQYFIFRKLYQDQPDKTLILIGDPKQAIYSFRGADVFTYQRAKKDTLNHFTLQTNYRSSESYIDVINRLFASNPDAFVFKLLIEFSHAEFNPQQPKKITENNKEVEPLVGWLYPFTVEPVSKALASEFFAACCAGEIEQLLRQKNLEINGEEIKASDLAVLVKTGRQAGMIKQQLSKRGIASALVLRDSVFASQQASEISQLLGVLIEPSNLSALFGLLSTDLFGWDSAQIYSLQLDNEKLVGLLEQIKDYQNHWQEKGILSMFFKLIQQQNTVQINCLHMEGERRLTNWLHIMELLQQQAIEHASPSQTLLWLKKQRQNVAIAGENEEHQLRLESDSNLVRIVTIHKSKGLEYPIVFLPFMWDVKGSQNQPKSYRVHDDEGRKQLHIFDETKRDRWHQENLAEEVRLLYVAMTRARYRCYLGWGNIKGAGSSALAQCLYVNQIKAGKYPRHLDIDTIEALRQPFEQMNETARRVKILEPEIHSSKLVSSGTRQVQLTQARKFKREVKRQWRISSYSQIANQQASYQIDRPDYDALMEPHSLPEYKASKEELDRFGFPKGAKAGTFLHDILEHCNFNQPVDKKLLSDKCREYGYQSEWIEALIDWIEDILRCDLKGFSLADISNEQKISEMEFYLTTTELQAKSLNRLLHQENYIKPTQTINFAEVNGFLKGFIDLVFEHNGRYYIADYKSNYLGPDLSFYSTLYCDVAMYEHHYHLQYLIYTLALHRYLQQRLKDYDYDQHMGGVYYLFLRGMSDEAQRQGHEKTGVFYHKPGAEFIQQLDTIF